MTDEPKPLYVLCVGERRPGELRARNLTRGKIYMVLPRREGIYIPDDNSSPFYLYRDSDQDRMIEFKYFYSPSEINT